jgi:predicted ATP-grasp superfamily ATP-dependent carboligase/predicted N-acyltransferase
MIEIEQTASLTGVDPAEWDGLVGHEVFASYGWLRTLEETHTEPAGYRYFMARRAGELVAAVPCQLYAGTGVSAIDHFLFGPTARMARGLGLAGVPALVCGTRIGMAEPAPVKDETSPALRRAILERLFRAVEEEARRTGSMVLVRHVAADSASRDALRRRGFLRTREMPTAYLELGWSSFADFRRHLRRIHPSTEKSMRWEISRGRRAGFVLERIDDPQPVGEKLHRLVDVHYRRLNRTAFPFRPSFFERLKFHLGERAVVTVARHERDLLGVTVGLRGADGMFVQMIGVDAERGRHGALYFNLGFNRPIQDAIAAGDRRLYLGKLLYDLKIRRGCRLRSTDVYLRGRDRLHQAMLRPLVSLRSLRLDLRTAAVTRLARAPRTGAGSGRAVPRRRVLVTNATSDAGLATMRALTRAGCDVLAADAHRLPLGARSRFPTAHFSLPEGNQEAFDAALVELVHALRPDAFLPLGNRAVFAAGRLRDRLGAMTALNVPDVAAFMAAYDKAACLASCRTLGIACPSSYSMDGALDALGQGDAGTVIVVKPRFDEGAARGVRYVRDPQTLAREGEACRERFGDVLLQEYIPGGPEAMKTVVVLFSRDSRLVAAFTTQKLRQWPPGGGLTAMSRSTNARDLVEEVLPFFEKWSWAGPAEVELKFDRRDGRHKLIEINPRFPAYLRFPLRCGLDLPALAVRLALGESVEPCPAVPGYAVGATYLDPGVFLRSAMSGLRRRGGPPLGTVARDLYRGLPGVLDMLADPVPLIGRALASMRRLRNTRTNF